MNAKLLVSDDEGDNSSVISETQVQLIIQESLAYKALEARAAQVKYITTELQQSAVIYDAVQRELEDQAQAISNIDNSFSNAHESTKYAVAELEKTEEYNRPINAISRWVKKTWWTIILGCILIILVGIIVNIATSVARASLVKQDIISRSARYYSLIGVPVPQNFLERSKQVIAKPMSRKLNSLLFSE